MLFTAIAFTWGEVFAALFGALLGGAAALGGMRLFSFVKRLLKRRQAEPAAAAPKMAPGPGELQ